MEPLYHPITARTLAAITARSGSFVFLGPAGSGRRLGAINLAQRLNCRNHSVGCWLCRSIDSGSFADLHGITSPTAVGIDLIAQLQQNLAQRPFSGDTIRVVIIEVDHGITTEAQNRLLKTLEEPPAQTIIILVAEQVEGLLPTVLSRCQLVNFIPLPLDQILAYLTATVGAEIAGPIAQLRPASIGEAIRLATDPELRQAYDADTNFATEFLGAATFRRLVMAQTVRLKPRAQELVGVMARKTAAEFGPLSRFVALERAGAKLKANVGPRAVMEALALVL